MSTLLAEPLHLIALTLFVFAVPFLRNAYVPRAEVVHDARLPVPKRDAVSSRFVVFDVLKGVAILAVIVIHAAYLWPAPSEGMKTFLVAVDASMRFALPIFFIASGILLTPESVQRLGVKRWYGAKLLALGVPYVLVATLAAYMAGMGVEDYVVGLVTGGISVPYYFLIILFQLYVLYPLLVPLARYRVFVYGALFFSIAWQLSPFWYVFDVPLAFRFMGLFVWGMYVRSLMFEGTLSRSYTPWLALVVLAVALYVVLPGQYFNMRPYYGVGMCMLLYGAYVQGFFARGVERVLAWLGERTLWIYLTHYLIMMTLVPWSATLFAPVVGPVLGFLGATLVSLVLCTLAGGLLQDSYGWLARTGSQLLPGRNQNRS